MGIGGIGMSSLARFFLSEDALVTGSDLESSDITETLKKEGGRIYIGLHDASHIGPRTSAVIYNAAIDAKNPELIEAKKRKLRIVRYSKAVGEISKKFTTIAITGSHGKSTTTALIAHMMIAAGLDPTVIIGTKIKEFGNSNFRMGNSRYLVLEADDYAESFLSYKPHIAVVTNIDKEHLDYYSTFANIIRAFRRFIMNVKPGGFLVLNNDDANVLKIGMPLMQSTRFRGRIKWYSLRNKEVESIKHKLIIPGIHNVSNALAAYRVGQILGIPGESAIKSISEFEGAWRRFEYAGSLNGAKLFHDYAHHPTEIRATLDAAKNCFPRARLWCIFQPHQHERLSLLFNEFTSAFDDAHSVVILDPYEVAGREKRIKTDSDISFQLTLAIDKRMKNDVYYIPYASELAEFIKKYALPDDVIILMGAGNIWKIADGLV